MKKLLLFLLFLLPLMARAQVSRDTPITWASSLPTQCSPTKKSTALVYNFTQFRFYVCTSTNNYTAIDSSVPTLDPQPAGTIYAAPTGASGVPSFRTITNSDLPILSSSKIINGAVQNSRCLRTDASGNIVVASTDCNQTASDSVIGSAKLSVPAATPSSPVVVADNDKRLGARVSAYASLNAAVTAMSVSGGTLSITQDTNLSSALVVPANVKLEKHATAKIIKQSGATITFEGLGINPEETGQIFSGFTANDISWTNEMPELKPEWFGCRADGVTDCTNAVNTAVAIAEKQPANGRQGGVLRFGGGVYAFNSQVGSETAIYHNIRLVGNSTKASSFGTAGGTILKYTGSGTTSAFRFRAAQSVAFENLTITYSSTSFTGILVDLSMSTGSGGFGARIYNSYLGGFWTAGNPVSPMGAKHLLYLSGQIEATVENSSFVGGESGIKLQPGLAEGGTDTNVIVIRGNTFNMLRGAAILNPYQGCIIEANNFETLNFALTFGDLPTPNSSMPFAIDYDNGFPGDAVQYGVKITGNWFGDRVGSGGGYIRLGRVRGGIIDGNFFGGGFNSFVNYGNIASGTSGGTTLTLAGQAMTSANIGQRVWVHSANYTGVITAILSPTTVTMDTLFSSSFSNQETLIATSQIREYKSIGSGTSGTDTITISGVTLPTDIWGRKVWVNGAYVGTVKSRTPTATTFTVTPNLTGTFSGANVQIGEYRYDSSSIEIERAAQVAVTGNYFGHGMHAVNTSELSLSDITDLSVTNGSNIVSFPEARYTPCDLLGKNFTAAAGIPSAGWSVPGGTTITAVGSVTSCDGSSASLSRGATTLTLSNNVTVASGQNPRRAQILHPFDGGTRLLLSGNTTPEGLLASTANPFTNSKTVSIFNQKNGGKYVYEGNSDSTGAFGSVGRNLTNFNQGFFSDDFAGADGVISIGNRIVAPTGNPASGVLLYSESNKLKVLEPTGAAKDIGVPTSLTDNGTTAALTKGSTAVSVNSTSAKLAFSGYHLSANAGFLDFALNDSLWYMQRIDSNNFTFYPTNTVSDLGRTATANRWRKLYLLEGLNYDATLTTAGTTGAQTINKPAGSVNFAAGASSLVLTNSLISTTSLVRCFPTKNDTTAKSCVAVAAAGSATLYLNSAATAETSVGFEVINVN